MSKVRDVLDLLKHCLDNAKGSRFDAVVQLPLEDVLRIKSLIQTQHSALKSADVLVEGLKNNYDKVNSLVQIEEDTIKINEVIIKSALR